MKQSPDMIIAFIAILKLGGVYLPIDISYPPDRIKFMLDDTNCKLIITDIVLNETITIYAAERIFVDELDYHGDQTHPQITENISPKDPAYIIYTSGSTGTPKGVIVPHQAIVRLVKDTNYIEIIPDDIIALLRILLRFIEKI